jgi:hypothetical protein
VLVHLVCHSFERFGIASAVFEAYYIVYVVRGNLLNDFNSKRVRVVFRTGVRALLCDWGDCCLKRTSYSCRPLYVICGPNCGQISGFVFEMEVDLSESDLCGSGSGNVE